jgi:hypothetical protein
MAESIALIAERITGGDVRLRILSNLADLRLARASIELTEEAFFTKDFSGRRIMEGIVDAYEFRSGGPIPRCDAQQGHHERRRSCRRRDRQRLARDRGWRARLCSAKGSLYSADHLGNQRQRNACRNDRDADGTRPDRRCNQNPSVGAGCVADPERDILRWNLPK